MLERGAALLLLSFCSKLYQEEKKFSLCFLFINEREEEEELNEVINKFQNIRTSNGNNIYIYIYIYKSLACHRITPFYWNNI